MSFSQAAVHFILQTLRLSLSLCAALLVRVKTCQYSQTFCGLPHLATAYPSLSIHAKSVLLASTTACREWLPTCEWCLCSSPPKRDTHCVFQLDWNLHKDFKGPQPITVRRSI